MKSLQFSVLICGVLLVQRCAAQTNVTGVAVDTDGKPIAGVRCVLSGYPLPSGGRINYSGMPARIFTDRDGHYSIPLPRGDPLIDLQFDGGCEHAPVFLYKVRPADSPLRVVMRQGKVLRGRVVERVRDEVVPVANAVIVLQMPQEGVWYQSGQPTDGKGEFQFRVSEPPGKWPWELYYAGMRRPVDYAQITPETVIVLEVDVKMTLMTLSAEQAGPANGSQPIRSQTNSTSSAAGSRR